MIEKVAENIWKFVGDSNVYFLNLEEPVMIDTSSRAFRPMLKSLLSKVVDFSKVKKVIFTHLHYDHTGNADLFENAEFYASKREIEDFKKNPEGAVLDEETAERLNMELKPLPDSINGLKVINTPGHTKGSVCLWYEKERILFSGDTLFPGKNIGRTDLPTSVPDEMQKSLLKLLDYNFKILCPGHG